MATKKTKKKPKLSPKNELFCQKYVVYHNATRAAKEAGHSERSAGVIGCRLLMKANIQARIVELQQATAEEFNIMKQYIIGVLMDSISAKMEDIIDPETGAVLPPNEWPDHMKRVISGMESEELYAGSLPVGLKRKVKLLDKNKSVEILNRMVGFNMPDKVAQTDSTGTQDIIPVIKVYPVQPKNDDDD